MDFIGRPFPNISINKSHSNPGPFSLNILIFGGTSTSFFPAPPTSSPSKVWIFWQEHVSTHQKLFLSSPHKSRLLMCKKQIGRGHPRCRSLLPRRSHLHRDQPRTRWQASNRRAVATRWVKICAPMVIPILHRDAPSLIVPNSGCGRFRIRQSAEKYRKVKRKFYRCKMQENCLEIISRSRLSNSPEPCCNFNILHIPLRFIYHCRSSKL